MNRYIEQQTDGELWIRELNDRVSPASSVLSGLYLKYKTINSTFYSELTSNKILRFDIFNDVVFLETTSASIFEKFKYEDNSITSFNQSNLINIKTNINGVYLTNVDYWYDENNNEISFVEIIPNVSEIFNGISFNIILKKFDCNSGTIVKNFNQYAKLIFQEITSFSDFVFEYPKITYNSDTKTYNVSLISRIEGVFGLISTNIINVGDFKVSELNGFFTNRTINKDLSETYPVDL